MSLLSKSAILAAADLPAKTVDVPEWGGAVRVRGLTGAERDAFEASILTGKGKDRDVVLVNLRAKLVAMCIVDADGKRIFDDADAALLGAKSAAALQRVFDEASRLSGLTAEDAEQLAGN